MSSVFLINVTGLEPNYDVIVIRFVVSSSILNVVAMPNESPHSAVNGHK